MPSSLSSTAKNDADEPKGVSEEKKRKFASKIPSKHFNPCEELSKMSWECLARNNYDKTMCKDYFAAFRECKGIWLKERREDRAKGRYW